MAELQLGQSEKSSFLKPLLIAAVALAVGAAALFYLMPRHVAEVKVEKVEVYPAHVVYGSPTQGMKVKNQRPDQTENYLYVAATVKVKDGLKLPLFLKDMTGTLTVEDGTAYQSSAVQKMDVAAVTMAFPEAKAMVTGPLLVRESKIDVGGEAEGVVLLTFQNVTKEMWEKRKSAVLDLAWYHQDPIEVELK